MSKNLIVPHQILSDAKDNLAILCTYIYMETKVGKDGALLTSLELLMRHCGYTYNKRSKELGYVDKVTDAVNYLKQINYIEEINDKYDVETLECVDVGKPATFFTVRINPDMGVRNEGHFFQVAISDYVKIVRYAKDTTMSSLGKMMYVFCFISRYIFRRRKNFADDYRYEEENMRMALTTPNYFFANYDRMSDWLGDGFSRSTLIRILKLLEECEVVHYSSVAGYKQGDSESRKRLGSVFVLHSKYWEAELNSAIEMERGKKINFTRKESQQQQAV